jgi:hypothetical protein
MNIMKTLRIAKELGSTQLAGSDMGISHLPKLLSAVLEADTDELVVLDFSGVDATASYLSQSVVKLVRMANAGEIDKFFIFACVNKHTRDDLEIVLKLQKMAAFLADSPDNISAGNSVSVIGHLDPLHRQTLDRVLATTSTTAGQLMSTAKGQSIQKTGWLNRLAFLTDQKLVRREKREREFVFKPIWEEK